MRTTSQVLAWARNSMTDRPERKLRSLVVVLTLLGMFAWAGTAHAANASWVVPPQVEISKLPLIGTFHRVP